MSTILGSNGQVDLPFSEEVKQDIFDNLNEYQEHPLWSQHIKGFATKV